MLGFLEVAVVENIAAPASDGSDFIHGKSWLVGFTTYRAIDPLVLAATLAWRYNLSRRAPDSAGPSMGIISSTARNPDDLFLINPSVSFAVNNEVTLTTGLQWRWQGADQLDGQSIGIRTTNTRLTLGLGHAWSQGVNHVATRIFYIDNAFAAVWRVCVGHLGASRQSHR